MAEIDESARVDLLVAALVPDQRGCRIWHRPPRSGGYPTAWINGRERRLTRYVLEKKLGRRILPGLVARHTCDNPMCVSQEHLVEGTPAQNTRDMIERGRAPWQTGRLVTPNTTGENHYAAKITERDVIEIRRLARDTELSQREIGLQYGLTQQTVSQIVRRQIWTHVDG